MHLLHLFRQISQSTFQNALQRCLVDHVRNLVKEQVLLENESLGGFPNNRYENTLFGTYDPEIYTSRVSATVTGNSVTILVPAGLGSFALDIIDKVLTSKYYYRADPRICIQLK